MLRAFFPAFALGVSLLAQTPSSADARVASIQVKGVKRYTAEEVTRLSGLEIGHSASPSDLAAAANRMASTGLFDTVRYSYSTANRAMTVTFEVVEAPWTVPVVLDNFVWLPDEQWITELRARVPSFDGTAPKNAAEFLTHALQESLQARGLPGRVDFVPQIALGGDKSTFVFVVRDPSPTVCTLQVKRAAAIPEANLVAPLKSLIGADYSRTLLMATAHGTLTDMYRRKGFWRARFDDPTATLGSCGGGVGVTLTVDEGAAYTWDRAEFSGNVSIGGDVLSKALGMKSGEIADFGKIDLGLRAVRSLYAEKGYLTERASFEPQLDDTSHKAVFAVSVSEGPQYRMGAVTVVGLRESDAAAVTKKWHLKPGDVYDESYETKFVRDEILPLKTASGGHGDFDRDLDERTQVVNVKIVFK
jgi:outer membrane protein assembly factor BamA